MFFQLFSLFFLIFTSLYGIISFIRLLVKRLFDKNKLVNAVFLLPLKGHEEEIEYILRGLCLRGSEKIVIVDFGMDRETREIVRQISEEDRKLSLLDAGAVPDYLAGLAGQ